MKFREMTIQKYFLLLLLLLSIVLSVGIIVPGYLQIRDFEWLEAKDYALDRGIRMREKIEQRIDILRNAGVADIPGYVAESKRDILEEFAAMEPDPRVIRFIFDRQGNKVFDGGEDASLVIEQRLLRSIDQADKNYLRYVYSGQNWMTTFQKQDQWGWYILSMMSEAKVYLDSQNYLLYVLAVSVLVLLMVLGLSIVLTYKIRQRASGIIEQLERYGSGQYDERLEITGPVELGILQTGINSMIDRIEMEILSRKSIEEELSLEKKHAEEINHAKAEYVRDMSDRAHNSMNSVCGFAELLSKTDLDSRQRGYVDNVLNASESLSSMVGDMLALSGIEMDEADDQDIAEEEAALMSNLLVDLDILLVGLNPMNCAYVSEILINQGVNPVPVHDESAAIKFLEEEDADLIMLDIDHSRFKSEESIAYIRSNISAYAGSIPILLMTSRSNVSKIAHYKSLGVAGGLSKPFNSSRILRSIVAIIRAEDV